MNEREATQLLERIGGMVDVSGPPVDRLVDAGKQASRRRRRWQVGGAAAAAAVVALGAGIVAQNSSGSDTAPPTSRTTPPTTDDAVPPLIHRSGIRLVGTNGVVVAVPAHFSTEDVPCGLPRTDTVTFRPDQPFGTCTISNLRATLVEVYDRTSPSWTTVVNQPGDHIDVDGMSAIATAAFCAGGSVRSVPRCYGTLTFPSAGVSFRVTSPRAAQVDTILGSARPVPDGYVTVPSVYAMTSDKAVSAIEAAGLVVDPPCEIPTCSTIVSGTEPPAGTPVEDGTAIALHHDGRYPQPAPTGDDLLGTWRPSWIGATHYPRGQRSHGDPQVLTFDRLGAQLWFTASEGCNDATGHVDLDGRLFSTSHVGYTLVGCTSPHPSVAGIVTAAAYATLGNGHLRLYDREMQLLATFVRTRAEP